MKILRSASKLVLLSVALATVAGVFTGNISEETFKTFLLMVGTYYFAKATPSGPSDSQ